jgi:uncharacterized protein YqeY
VAGLKDRIGEDMRTAMKRRDQVRVSTLRMLMAAVKNAEVQGAQARELSDEEVVGVVGREAKRRKEAIEAYSGAGRADLAEKENAELAVLQEYLPEALSNVEVEAMVDAAIAETGATGPKQMGEVMKAVMPKVRGRADGAAISAIVKRKLGA